MLYLPLSLSPQLRCVVLRRVIESLRDDGNHASLSTCTQVSDRYLEPLVLRAGTSAAVEVPFAGSPQPKVAWMVGGQVLRDVRRVRVETIYNLTTLVISRAERSDAGTYTLSLENQFGTSNLTVQVVVLGTVPKITSSLR